MGKGKNSEKFKYQRVKLRNQTVFSRFLRVFTDYFFGVRRFCAPHLNREMAQINKAKSREKGGEETHKPATKRLCWKSNGF